MARHAILHLICSLHRGGTETQMVQLVNNLAASRQFDVHVGLLRMEGELLGELNRNSICSITEMPVRSFFKPHFGFTLAKTVQYLRRNQIQVVHTHDFYSNVLGIISARLARTRAIIASKRETRFVRTRSQEKVETALFRFADRIVANSRAVEQFLSSAGVKASKLKVIYNSVETNRYLGSVAARARLHKILRLPASTRSRFVILVANMRSEVKNHALFLNAASLIAPTFPDVHFIIIGDGPIRSRYEDLANSLALSGRVHFLGARNDVSELLAGSDIGVLSSNAEGFSNAILEYMAAGLPVVATRVGGADELVTEGKTGFLVSVNDSSAMADRIAVLLNDREMSCQMGRAGRELVEREYSAERQLASMLALYQGVL